VLGGLEDPVGLLLDKLLDEARVEDVLLRLPRGESVKNKNCKRGILDKKESAQLYF
jgi:hypothetical protein